MESCKSTEQNSSNNLNNIDQNSLKSTEGRINNNNLQSSVIKHHGDRSNFKNNVEARANSTESPSTDKLFSTVANYKNSQPNSSNNIAVQGPGQGITSNKNSLLGKIANSRGLKIASLNINSLLAHIDELRAYMTSGPIDILAIN